MRFGQHAAGQHMRGGELDLRGGVVEQRPLPRSKKEAIDLMMEQPNLIKRPILIRGGTVTFGFDKAAYVKGS